MCCGVAVHCLARRYPLAVGSSQACCGGSPGQRGVQLELAPVDQMHAVRLVTEEGGGSRPVRCRVNLTAREVAVGKQIPCWEAAVGRTPNCSVFESERAAARDLWQLSQLSLVMFGWQAMHKNPRALATDDGKDNPPQQKTVGPSGGR